MAPQDATGAFLNDWAIVETSELVIVYECNHLSASVYKHYSMSDHLTSYMVTSFIVSNYYVAFNVYSAFSTYLSDNWEINLPYYFTFSLQGKPRTFRILSKYGQFKLWGNKSTMDNWTTTMANWKCQRSRSKFSMSPVTWGILGYPLEVEEHFSKPWVPNHKKDTTY